MNKHTGPHAAFYPDSPSATLNPPRGKSPTSPVAATRYKEPEFTLEELSLVGWFGKLSREEQLALLEQAHG